MQIDHPKIDLNIGIVKKNKKIVKKFLLIFAIGLSSFVSVKIF